MLTLTFYNYKNAHFHKKVPRKKIYFLALANFAVYEGVRQFIFILVDKNRGVEYLSTLLILI
jgi:hypothetical protein